MDAMDEETEPNTPSSMDAGDPTKATRSSIFRCRRYSPRIIGRFLALFGALLTAINLTVIKYLFYNKFPAPEALISRYTPSLMFVIIIGLYIKVIRGNHNWYLFSKDFKIFNILSIRAWLHWSANLCTMYSLVFIPVMINISLFYTWVIFAIILSHFCLNEKATLWDILLCLIGLGGVIMITDPTFHSFASLGSTHLEGIILIVVAAFFYAVQIVILRLKRADYHWMQTESVAGLWATVILTPLYVIIMHYLFEVPMNKLIEISDITPVEWMLFLGISVTAFIGIGGVVHAFQLENVVIISVILYSEVAFGTLFQWIFLGDTTNFNTYGLWIGILCVILSTSLIMYRQAKEQNKSNIHSHSHLVIKNGYKSRELSGLLKQKHKECNGYGSIDDKKT